MKIDFNFVITLLLAGALVIGGSNISSGLGSMLVILGSVVIVFEMVRANKKKSK
jgi:hypothetical protein